MIFLLFSLSFQLNEFTLTPASQKPSSSADEEEKALSITTRAKKKVDQCYANLDSQFKALCRNLDVYGRKKLTIAIMICEQNQDGRGGCLPVYNGDDDDFILKLDQQSYHIFTTIFTNIDTICYHAAYEEISSENLHKMLNVYKSISVSTEFLTDARKNLDETTIYMRKKLANVRKKIDNETNAMLQIQNSIDDLFNSMQNITTKAMQYKRIITSIKFYIAFIVLSFLLSLSFQEILIPTIGLTFVFAVIEMNGKFQLIYYPLFKWCYTILYFLIVIILVLNHLKYIKIPSLLSIRKETVKEQKNNISKLIISEPVVFVVVNSDD